MAVTISNWRRWPAWLVVAVFCLGQIAVKAADARQQGAEIYRKLCVECHGKKGEGVKGKYDDELFGDWSMEKLTRYITKNMPDEAPEKCVGADAEAVAQYIHEAFYSREARARNNPVRVELVRLTNRQYINSVADLIAHFQGGKNDWLTGKRGLPGTYNGSRNGRQGEKPVEQVDTQIQFDFGTNNPPWAAGTTNGFSMRWRGSLITDETGDHDFILVTPNGARLWVNDDDEPLIDGSVASGDLHEQKATLRLIGGRAYPFRLEFFKNPRDKTASISLQWKPPHGAQMPVTGRNFSPERVAPTFVITTPFPADDSSMGYERGVSVSPEWDEAATHAAIEVAGHVVKNLDQFSHSKPNDTNRVEKVESFCREFVSTAFRRPLTPELEKLFVTGWFDKKTKLEDSVKRVVLFALKSPRFLYLGLHEENPDDFTVAQRLAIDLWDSIPDRELTQAAAGSRLHTPEQVQTQAERMLRDPRARAKMQVFMHHWLQMNRVEDLSKDDTLFPGFTPEIISDLRTSLNIFIEDVVWSDTSDYRKLLLADYLYLNNRLAAFYGVKTNATDGFVKVAFKPGERSGVLTHPYLLAEFSYQKSTSPIHRGVFLTRNIVGRALRPPPVAVAFKDADFDPHLTMREKVTELTKPQACQACHSVINPLGFTLEHFDAVGRLRTDDNGRAINALSDYTTDDGKVVRLAGPRDVAEFAVASEHSKNRFIEQMFHEVAKQAILAYGIDLMDRLRESFEANGCNIQKLWVEIASLTARHGLAKTVSAKN